MSAIAMSLLEMRLCTGGDQSIAEEEYQFKSPAITVLSQIQSANLENAWEIKSLHCIGGWYMFITENVWPRRQPFTSTGNNLDIRQRYVLIN